MIHSKRKLREALTDILGPHRITSRAEVYVDRANIWHVDGIYMYYGHYGAPLDPFYRKHSPDEPWKLCVHTGRPGIRSLKLPGEGCSHSLHWGSLDNNETSSCHGRGISTGSLGQSSGARRAAAIACHRLMVRQR